MDDMEAAANRAEESARNAEEAARRARREYTLNGPSSVKKARIQEAGQEPVSAQQSEALQKLQASIAAAISTVSGNVIQQQQQELQAKAISLAEEGGESVQSFAQSTPQPMPVGMLSTLALMSSQPAASSREPQYEPMKPAPLAAGDEDTVGFLRKHMQWMNREAGLKAVLEVEKVLNVAKWVEFGFNMKVLKDLEDKRARVNDPTAYVCAALRRVAGNESSPYNQVPKTENAGETARIQQQLGAPFSAAAAIGQQQDPMAAASKVSQLFIPPQILAESPQLQQAYMLAEHAEQCARTASSAAAMYKTNANANPTELQALQETAGQASERVSWAVGWIDSYMPPAHPNAMQNIEMDPKEQWMIGVREIVKNAAILAAAASKTCTHW